LAGRVWRTWGAAEPVNRGRARLELGREAARDDLAPRRLLLSGEIRTASAERLPQRAEPAFATRVVLRGGDLVHEVIAAGAVAFPTRRQGLAAQQDLFHHQIGAPDRFLPCQRV